jgi:hypothetical protein
MISTDLVQKCKNSKPVMITSDKQHKEIKQIPITDDSRQERIKCELKKSLMSKTRYAGNMESVTQKNILI